ncbi:hypothetical protein [Deinococcus sp. Marseille-Q6407]|uniref:hypothetical protein n=1 Tax=Deinococcus sp. Marseille-Q6407 TaxID=2969223 RepID=UPI0021BFF8AD|nr:hypothetical protein [Deinococcus sp. Marseille-Q6407]
MPHHLALALTGFLLLTLLTLGLGLQLRLWQTARRWHHLLFFAVVTGVLLSGGLAWRAGRTWLWLLPALGLLLLMPRTRPGRGDHWRLALVSAAAFVLGAWGSW